LRTGEVEGLSAGDGARGSNHERAEHAESSRTSENHRTSRGCEPPHEAAMRMQTSEGSRLFNGCRPSAVACATHVCLLSRPIGKIRSCRTDQLTFRARCQTIAPIVRQLALSRQLTSSVVILLLSLSSLPLTAAQVP